MVVTWLPLTSISSVCQRLTGAMIGWDSRRRPVTADVVIFPLADIARRPFLGDGMRVDGGGDHVGIEYAVGGGGLPHLNERDAGRVAPVLNEQAVVGEVLAFGRQDGELAASAATSAQQAASHLPRVEIIIPAREVLAVEQRDPVLLVLGLACRCAEQRPGRARPPVSTFVTS